MSTSELRSVHKQQQNQDSANLEGQGTRIAFGSGYSQYIISGATDGQIFCLPTQRWTSNNNSKDAIASSNSFFSWKVATANAANAGMSSALLSEQDIQNLPESERSKLAVTAVAYHPQTNVAASGTRGGHVFLHRHVAPQQNDKTNNNNNNTIAAGPPSTSTQLMCRVTSCVRSVAFTKNGSELIVTGESVRVFSLTTSGIRALRVNVPPPILSASLSPCEKWIALISAGGDVGIVPFKEDENADAFPKSIASSQNNQTQTQKSQHQDADNNNNNNTSELDTIKPTTFALPKQIPSELQKDENVVPRTFWCQVPSYNLAETKKDTHHTNNNKTKEDAATTENQPSGDEIPAQLLLSVPGEGGFRVYHLTIVAGGLQSQSQQYKLVLLGFVALPFDTQQQQQLQQSGTAGTSVASRPSVISSVQLFPMSKHKLQAIVLSTCKDVTSGSRVAHLKLDRKFKKSAEEIVAHTCPISITEIGLNPFAGALVYGTYTGDVGFIKKFCAPLLHQKPVAAEIVSSTKTNDNNEQQQKQQRQDGAEQNDQENDEEDDEDHDPYDDDSTATNDDEDDSSSDDKKKKTKKSTMLLDEDDADNDDNKQQKDKKKKNKKKKYEFSSSSAEESDLEGLVNDLVASAPKYVSSDRRRRVRRNDDDQLLRTLKNNIADGEGDNEHSDDDHQQHSRHKNKDKSNNKNGVSNVLLDDSDEERERQRRKRRQMFIDDEAEEGDDTESEGSSEEGFEAGGQRKINNSIKKNNMNKIAQNKKKNSAYGALDDDDDDVLADDDEEDDEDEEGDDVSPASFSRHRRTRRDREEGYDGDDDDDAANNGGVYFSSSNPQSMRMMQMMVAMQQQSGGSGLWEKPFQIGATEPDDNGFMYHAFNNIGVIRSNPETSVAFHDKSKSVIRINRPGLVCFGALGPYGAALLISNDASAIQLPPPSSSSSANHDNNADNILSQNQDDAASVSMMLSEIGDENGSNNLLSTQQQEMGDSVEEEQRKQLKKIENQKRYSDRLANAKSESTQFELYFRAFAAIGNHADWHLPINVVSEGGIRCLAVGKRYVALFTERYLRIFTSSGFERGVISLPHSVICASGFNTSKCPQFTRDSFDPLLYCYQESPGAALTLRVLNIEKQEECLKPVQLPLSMVQYDHFANNNSHHNKKNNKNINNNNSHVTKGPPLGALAWLGLSDDGTVCCADRMGTVFSHTADWGGSFQPVCEPHRAGDTSSPWIWHVTDDKVWCFKSSSTTTTSSSSAIAQNNKSFPPVTMDIPSPEILPMRVPALGAGILNDTVWALRQHYLRISAKANDLKRNSEFYTEAIAKLDIQLDQILLRLFEIELKDERVTKALDLASYFQLTSTLEKATRFAHEQGKDDARMTLMRILEYRMKQKKKRLCGLPVEGSIVSEKDRDKLLRQLLANQKNVGGGGVVVVPSVGNVKQDAAVPSIAAAPSAAAMANMSPNRGKQTQQQQSPSRLLQQQQNQAVNAPLGLILPSPPKNSASAAVSTQQQQSAATTSTLQYQQQQKQKEALKNSSSASGEDYYQSSSSPSNAATQSQAKSTSSTNKPSNFFNKTSSATTSNHTQQQIAPPKRTLFNTAAAPSQKKINEDAIMSPTSTSDAMVNNVSDNTSNSNSAQKESPGNNNNNKNPISTIKSVTFNLPSNNPVVSPPQTTTTQPPSPLDHNIQQKQQQTVAPPPPPKPVELMPSSGMSLDQLAARQQQQQQNQNQQSEAFKATLSKFGVDDEDEGNSNNQASGLDFF